MTVPEQMHYKSQCLRIQCLQSVLTVARNLNGAGVERALPATLLPVPCPLWLFCRNLILQTIASLMAVAQVLVARHSPLQ